MKRILFYLSRYPAVGGIENVTTRIINEICNDFDIEIISHKHQPELKVEVDCKIHFFPDSQNYFSKENQLFFDNFLASHKFDALVYQDSYAPTEKIVTLASSKYGIPLYTFEHNSPLFIENKRNLDSKLSFKGFLRVLLHPYLLYRDIRRRRLLLDNSKKYILLSKSYIPVFTKLIGRINIDNKIIHINNPTVPKKLDIDLSKKSKTILYVGRLVKEKRVDLILEIWNSIQSKLPDWNLKIVGDGSERKHLEKIANKYSSANRITFEGYQNPDQYYQEATIFVMTSKFEGWPMTLIEAMQYGCVPVALNTFHSLPDIIDNKENGIIASNIDEMIQTILHLANDRELRQRMGMSATSKVKMFDIKYIKHQWINLLSE